MREKGKTKEKTKEPTNEGKRNQENIIFVRKFFPIFVSKNQLTFSVSKEREKKGETEQKEKRERRKDRKKLKREKEGRRM